MNEGKPKFPTSDAVGLSPSNSQAQKMVGGGVQYLVFGFFRMMVSVIYDMLYHVHTRMMHSVYNMEVSSSSPTTPWMDVWLRSCLAMNHLEKQCSVCCQLKPHHSHPNHANRCGQLHFLWLHCDHEQTRRPIWRTTTLVECNLHIFYDRSFGSQSNQRLVDECFFSSWR